VYFCESKSSIVQVLEGISIIKS